MNDTLDFRAGLKDTLPTVFGYIGIGLAFGIVSRSSGFSALAALLTALITYSGAAQFVIVSMITAGSPFVSIVFSVFMLSARMILTSMTVAPYYKKESMLRNIILGTLLTDETFALTMSKLNYTDHRLSFEWLNAANIFAYSAWAAASLAGNLLGSLIQDPEKFGLDYALVAMFIGLLYLQVIGDRSIKLALQGSIILIVLVLTYVGMIFIPSGILTLVVTIIACLVGMGVRNHAKL
ncbi:AzlC family ABC transporter permease [Lacticaseibacillus zhaodongensis]|uniref:AzlC family ABC transporter permease n=1 Tax=Lacticaseibacillus zhaodongensis TaxID=2668065 RepID=UPI0012D36AEB|nr:AzlC family ABC transporter permease [Lacticaseibacillus zhaodongensis]